MPGSIIYLFSFISNFSTNVGIRRKPLQKRCVTQETVSLWKISYILSEFFLQITSTIYQSPDDDTKAEVIVPANFLLSVQVEVNKQDLFRTEKSSEF